MRKIKEKKFTITRESHGARIVEWSPFAFIIPSIPSYGPDRIPRFAPDSPRDLHPCHSVDLFAAWKWWLRWRRPRRDIVRTWEFASLTLLIRLLTNDYSLILENRNISFLNYPLMLFNCESLTGFLGFKAWYPWSMADASGLSDFYVIFFFMKFFL
jgi:hypothetical protein